MRFWSVANYEEMIVLYIYENHMGGLYVSEDILDDDLLFCEICGDYDWLLGCVDTREEAWDLLKDDTDINGSGGWSYDYVQDFLNKYFVK